MKFSSSVEGLHMTKAKRFNYRINGGYFNQSRNDNEDRYGLGFTENGLRFRMDL